jgi:hypothetical protein
LLDSEEKCAAVVDAHSSYLPPASTVGNEAAMMVDGFRQGSYPPRLSARYGAAAKQELREWWQTVASRGPSPRDRVVRPESR